MLKKLKSYKWYRRIKYMLLGSVYYKQLTYLKKHCNISYLYPATGKTRDRQLRLLAFYSECKCLTDSLGVNPFLFNGSLLGGIRHKGFIPWDDDIDLAMMRYEYNHLIHYMENKNLLFLMRYLWKENDKNQKWMDSLAQKIDGIFSVLDYDGTLHLIKADYVEKKIILDIYPLDFIKEGVSFELYKKSRIKWEQETREMKEASEYLNFFREIAEKNEYTSKSQTNDIYVGANVPIAFDCTFKNMSNFIPYDMIFPLRNIKFENTEIMAPAQSEQLLQRLYGNYMTFPDDLGYSHHFNEYCE